VRAVGKRAPRAPEPARESADSLETALQSNRLLETAIEQAAESVVITDRKGTIRYVNPAFTRVTGFSAGEAVGRNPRILRSGAHDAVFYRRLWETISAGEIWRGKIVNRRRDGTLFEEEMSITPVRDAAGRVTHFIAIKQDVSARKKAEEELRRTQFIVDHIADMVAWVDATGRILYANDAAARGLAYPKEEIHALRVPDVAPEIPPEAWPQAWKTAKRMGVRRFESRIRRKDGSLFPASLTISHVVFDGREYQCAILQDLTERDRAAETLRETQARLADILEHSTNLFYTHTPDHRLTYVSPQARSFFDCEPEEALVRWTEFATDNPINRAGFEATVRALETGARQPPYELELRTRTGRTIWVEVNEAPVVRDGRVEGIVGALTDVTQRKMAERERGQIEEQLRQAQKLEAVGRLAGGVAHDFNNLLSVINGYGEILLGSLSVQDPRRGKVEQILEAGRRATGLTGQLLAFSRKQDASPRVVDLNALVTETQKMLHRLIGEDVDLEIAPAPDLSRVRIDPSHLDQVVLNLAVNARDAMPTGGRLRIETANVDLDEDFARLHPPTRPGRYVLLSVADTGCGMGPETLAHIFEPFFTTKEPGKGTGLGLATVYGIVKQAGGYIWAESRPGEGTTFRIYLPVVEGGAAAAPSSVAVDNVPRGDETLLVVEDSEPLRLLVRELAESLGYRVLLAENGPGAIDLVQRSGGDIDLILTDVILPGMNGRELAARLQEMRPGLRILFVSGYARDVLGERGGLDPKVRLLQKPFNRQALGLALREILDASSP
jgi:PAS domain S-box-containing protein